MEQIEGNAADPPGECSRGDLLITLLPEGTVSFTNSAPDLDQVQVERLFERFFTVEAARHSTGLGLSIARTLTERMGGAIQATCQNRSLTITVCFPPV